MSPFSPFSEPNPSGSPLEKIKISRRSPTPKDFSTYLQQEGVDPDLAQRIGRAVQQWDQEFYFENLETLINIEMWANTHTHEVVESGNTHMVAPVAENGAGNPGVQTYLYEFSSDTWIRVADAPVDHTHGTGSVYGNKAYIFCPTGDTNGVLIYDPVSDSWSSGTDRPVGNQWGSAALVGDNFYIYGGISNTRHDVYNITTDSWQNLSNGSTGTRWQGSCPLPGVIDGYCMFGGALTPKRAFRYEPSTDTWVNLPSIPTVNDWPSNVLVTYLDSLIYMLNGNYGDFLSFDPVTDSYTVLASPPSVNINAVSCATPEGKLIFQDYMYDPATDTWSTLSTIPFMANQGTKHNMSILL